MLQMPNPWHPREAERRAVLTFDGGKSGLSILFKIGAVLVGLFLNLLLFFFSLVRVGVGGCKQTHMNKDLIRVLSHSPLRRKRSTQETGSGETQTRTKDSPLGLDVQPQQSFSAEPVTPPKLTERSGSRDSALTPLPCGSLLFYSPRRVLHTDTW